MQILQHEDFTLTDVVPNIRRLRQWRNRLPLSKIRGHEIKITTKNTPSTAMPTKDAYTISLRETIERVLNNPRPSSLMDIDTSHGLRASFQVVPEERYEVPDSFVSEIRSRGFEFNIHDLNHDGRLFEEKTEFWHGEIWKESPLFGKDTLDINGGFFFLYLLTGIIDYLSIAFIMICITLKN